MFSAVDDVVVDGPLLVKIGGVAVLLHSEEAREFCKVTGGEGLGPGHGSVLERGGLVHSACVGDHGVWRQWRPWCSAAYKKKQSAIAAQLNSQRTFIFHQGKASQIR